MIREATKPRKKKNWFNREPERLALPHEEFLAIIEREKARVGRNHHMFSLLTMDSGGRAGVRKLVEVATRRLRQTDVLGHIDPGQIGILLPETPASGAQAVAKNISQAMASASLQLNWEVTVFPPDEANASRPEDPRQLRLFADPDRRLPLASAPHTPSA